MDETIVFLDGNYLSKISKYFGGNTPLKFNINQFARTLAKQEGLWCSGVFYYTAPPYQSPKPTTDENLRKRNYDKFIHKLRTLSNFVVREGRCQKVEGEYHQKGVDALLIRDLLSLREKNIKVIILLACDTDFVPILNELREKYSIKVILAYFSDFKRRSLFSMSNYILTACDKKLLLTKNLFERSKLLDT